MVIAFLPVRIGSKSIPKKNIMRINGQPLLYWALRALSQSNKVDRIVVALDSEEIAEIVANIPLEKIEIYRRDPVNAMDSSSTESVMLEYLGKCDFDDKDIFLLAQATSPLVRDVDVNAIIELLVDSGFDSALTCVHFKRFLWDAAGVPINYNYKTRPRRQDFPGCFMENGALYASRVGHIRRTGCRLGGKIGIHPMPEESAMEIDEPSDWGIIEELLHNTSQTIRYFFSDVDGVLTDGGMYYDKDGDALKKFNTRDGMAFELLRKAGVKTGLITSEKTEIVARRAAKLKVDFVIQGASNKVEEMRSFLAAQNAVFSDLAYIGDDLNDLGLIALAGISAAPADATSRIKDYSRNIMNRRGGEGVMREFADLIVGSKSLKK